MEYEATKTEADRVRKQIAELSDAELVTVNTEMYNNGLENLSEWIARKAKSINFMETPF